MNSKPWYTSRTLWIETFQAFIGIATGIVNALQVGFTPETCAAFAVGFKGIYGIFLRFDTKMPIDL